MWKVSFTVYHLRMKVTGGWLCIFGHKSDLCFQFADI